MTKIHFYVGSSQSLQARLRLACKLVAKAQRQALHTYIHTDSADTSLLLDELIWTFDDLSFIPHALASDVQPPLPTGNDSPSTSNVNVWIGDTYEPVEQCDFLINLSNDTPAFFSRFERMAEILDQEDSILSAGRKRYQFYRERGYNLEYHQLR